MYWSNLYSPCLFYYIHMFLQQHKHLSLEFLLLTFYSGNCTDIQQTVIIKDLYHIVVIDNKFCILPVYTRYFVQYIATFNFKQVHKMNSHLLLLLTGRNF